MSDKKRASGLGRGLSALLEEIGTPASSPAGGGTSDTSVRPTMLPITRIRPNPRQPRRHFDQAALNELIESVKLRGLVQPILVRPNGGVYEIVAGERRWRAAQAAQLHEVPVGVRELDDSAAFEIALIENVQRADLNPIEEAEGYQRLMHDFGHTQDAISQLVGKSRSHVANLLRLLNLPSEVRQMVSDGRLSMGHARAILSVANPEELARHIVDKGLSVRETEALAASEQGRSRDPKPRSSSPRADSGYKDPDTEALERALAEAIGLKVTIRGTGQAGKVEIDYSTLDQLDALAQRLIGGRF